MASKQVYSDTAVNSKAFLKLIDIKGCDMRFPKCSQDAESTKFV